MIEPTGPLPPSVYWRRRVFAVGGAVLALGLIVWLLSWAADDSVAPTSGTGGGEQVAASAPPEETGSSAPAGSAASSSNTPTSSGKPTASGSSGAPSGTSAGSRVTTSKSEPKPAPPKECRDKVLKLVVELGKPAYKVGERPRMTMVLTNAGPHPCVKNVSRQLRELVVTTKDGRRLWSSLDCYPPKTNEKPVLQPGQQLRFGLKWAGRTSRPGCPVDREQVPPGDYLVTGKIGGVTSAPVPLELT